MKRIYMLLCLSASICLATICFAGNYNMAPDGSSVGGDSYNIEPDPYNMAPDGSSVGGDSYNIEPDPYNMAPGGSSVGD